MIRHEIARLVTEAAERARADGSLPDVALPEITIEKPQRAEHGDYATNLPLQLARAAKANPIELAKTIAAKIASPEAIAKVEVAPPGFINFHLSDGWLAGQVDEIERAGPEFANLPVGQAAPGGHQRRVQVEFVSANPTGPLHAGNGRWAAMGSTLVRVLRAAGYDVEAEYYFNDAGTQVETFGRTLYARYQQLFGRDVPVPEDGYAGSYMVDLAQQAKERFGDTYLLPEDAGAGDGESGIRELAPPTDSAPGLPPSGSTAGSKASSASSSAASLIRELAQWGLEQVMDWIKKDLTDLGVHYDVWYREQTVYEAGHYDKVMALLRERKLIAEREGAVWLSTTLLGADKDEVLIRSSGAPTYLATDIGYHYDKFLVRDFHTVIDIWGADHQGHVRPLQLATQAMGIEEGRLEIIIGQLVTLRRGEEVLKLSKRSGDIILLRDVIDEIGRDACLYFFLSRSADVPIDLDLELAKRQSAENPVYYVQYAHARICSILATAQEKIGDVEGGDTRLLTHPAELSLIRKMLMLPELVETIAISRQPHHLPHYAQELATAFHDFYEKCRVVDAGQLDTTRARITLVRAAKSVLATALGLMGMSAPDKM